MTREKERQILEKSKKKKKNNLKIDIFFIILSLMSSIYLIYNLLLLGPIERAIRYVIIGLICLVNLVMIINLFRNKKKKKRIKKSIKRFFLLLLIIANVAIGYNIGTITSILGGTNKKYVTTSTSLVTLKSNSISDVKKIKNAKIAIGDSTEDTESYLLPQQIIAEYKLDDDNEIVEYQDYQTMIRDLYDKKVQYIFLPTDYVSIYGEQEEYETLAEDTKILVSTSKKETKEEKGLLGTSKDISKPFTILLLGVDSKTDGIENADSFNGDAMILVTFNPDTLTATMLSIPRDSYVPIACFTNKTENKITHAASRGTKCAINTIQNYFDVTIDYYVKINFTGLVQLVDALGGIDVDVPYALCEQNSKRQWGKNTVYVEKGLQHLNGEQALALSRNRKANTKNHYKCGSKYLQGTRNDFIRGQNQQLVIRAIIEKIKDIDDIATVKKILKTLSNNMDNNMSLETILSFYNIAKDIVTSSNSDGEFINIQKLYLAGADQTIYDERTNLELYNYIPNEESKQAIIQAMKMNLGLVKVTADTSFSYSIQDLYEQNTIGKYPKSYTRLYTLIPDFTTYTRSQAASWGTQNGFNVVFKEVETNKYADGKIYAQSYPRKKRTDLCSNKTITLTIAKKKQSVSTPIDDNSNDQNSDTTTDTPTDSTENNSEESNDNNNSNDNTTDNNNNDNGQTNETIVP